MRLLGLRIRLTRFFVIASLTIIPLISAAWAQSVTTRLFGTVKDSTGGVLPGVTVQLIDEGTKRVEKAVTNDEGYYIFSGIPAGYYTVTAELPGFKKAVVTGVKADVSIPATVNMDLEVGEVTDSVTVSAATAQAVVRTESAELLTVVQQKQLEELPLNGRNPVELAGLQAGVATNGSIRASSVNGLRGSFTNLTWDGININDNFIRTDSFFAAGAPSVEAIAEFSITTSNVGADAGLGVAQVKMVTRRGTNEYHGSLFEFHRNDALDANSFFNNFTRLPKEKLIRNTFGANGGGPIIKEKFFFYGFYQGTRERSAASIQRTVLVGPTRQGLFTYRRQDNGQLETVNLLTISGAAVDPRMRALVDLTPLPNDLTTGDRLNFSGFRFNSGVISDSNLYGARLDYNLSNAHSFEGVFDVFTFDFPNDTFNNIGEPFPGRPGVGQKGPRPRGTLAWHWLPRSNVTNELRGGLFHSVVKFATAEPFAEGYRLGFPTSPLTVATNPVQNTLPQGRTVDVYELIDNASWVRGKHEWRFGGNIRWVSAEPFNAAGIIPIYNLGFNVSGNPNPLRQDLFPGGILPSDLSNASNILAVLGGYVNNATQTFNVTSRTSGFVSGAPQKRNITYHTVGFYLSDSWRLKPNFRLNLGLRWEYITPATEKNGLALLPLGGLGALRDPNAVIDFAGAGTGRPFFRNDYNNFAPSVSIAWDPFKTGKTSILAGYSVSYAIDSNVTTVQNAFNNNGGLSQGINRTNVRGTVSGGGIVPIAPPPFQVPRTIADNLALDPNAAVYTIDPNLRTPYVQQWRLGIERELFKDTAARISYVGNHAVKLIRAIDVNQVRIRENGFLEDFLRAQRNLQNTGDPARGEPLQVFPSFPNGGNLNNTTVRTYLQQGQVGELANFYITNRVAPSLGFFLPNPNAYVADFVNNGSFSNYHGLQLEGVRRLRSGLYLQANYTFSKVFTDYEGSDTNFSALLDNASGVAKEKKRASFDVTHVFHANWTYELPFGPGKRFANISGPIGQVIGGWNLAGIWNMRSGRPISFISNYGTLNRLARSGKNTANATLSISELQNLVGDFRDTQGRPNIFNPRLIGPDGRANRDLFQNPPAGTLGTLQLTPVSGPKYFNMDLTLFKRFFITETKSFDFRAEFFNVWNNVNWSASESQDINSPSFGRINSTFAPRILQFALKFNF